MNGTVPRRIHRIHRVGRVGAHLGRQGSMGRSLLGVEHGSELEHLQRVGDSRRVNGT